MESQKFPEDFIWGTATAAFQIEGATTQDGRGPGIWDVFCRQPGRIARGEDADVACDHYHRWREDIDLIAGVAPHYRFSTCWARLLPEGAGAVNEKGVAFYDRLIDGLLARGVTPWTTMYHWNLPQALQDRGGWVNRDIMGWFGDYADLLLRRFGDRVKNWIILNEPSVHSWCGHGMDMMAPGLKGAENYLPSLHHMNLTVGQVYRQIKSEDAGLNVGSSYTLMPVRGEAPDTDPQVVAMKEAIWNGNFFEPLIKGRYPEITQKLIAPYVRDGDMKIIRTDLDFIGVQHYDAVEARRDETAMFGVNYGAKPPEKPKTAMGWSIDPEGFYECLMAFRARYGDVPLVITENGVAFEDVLDAGGQCHDPQRISFLRGYLGALHRAMGAGVPVKGYFVWSLMDNFEWNQGYRPRFGLVYVDYADHCRRIPKDSYGWYRDVAASGALF